MERKYRTIFDADDFIDGIDFDSFEEARNTALEIMETWRVNEMMEWKDPFHPTEEEIDRYDAMIENFCAWVEEYDEESEEYEDTWYPSDEDLDRIFWKPYEDLGINLEESRS